MAWLETIHLTRFRLDVANDKVSRQSIEGFNEPYFPQLCWNSGHPWREANQWLLARLEEHKNIATVSSDARGLHAYAQWLEETGTDWLEFPLRQRDRCLVRYRGALMESMRSSQLRPSTAAMRMRVVIRFYRWLQGSGLLDPDTVLWREEEFTIEKFDATGFVRTIKGTTTNLAISNRPAPGLRLEDGLLPLSEDERDRILDRAQGIASAELHLMLSLGFFTGMRLGTICDLKVETIFNAARHTTTAEVHFLAIGPGARPPVHTKFDVTGQALIPTSLLELLRDYCLSSRRAKRLQKAPPENRNLVFITRFGNSYIAKRGRDKSASINVELHRLKKVLRTEDPRAGQFKFHQTRATFATQVARIAACQLDAATAIAVVQDLLMHKDERTSEKYIKFNEQSELKSDLANEFTRSITGVISRSDGSEEPR